MGCLAITIRRPVEPSTGLPYVRWQADEPRLRVACWHRSECCEGAVHPCGGLHPYLKGRRWEEAIETIGDREPNVVDIINIDICVYFCNVYIYVYLFNIHCIYI